MVKTNNSAICLLAKNENEYINEWLEWHLKLGINHIYIYDNESIIPINESINNQFLQYCTIINWGRNDFRFNMQQEAYSHFLKYYGDKTKWVAFIDADEFIRLIDNDDINSFLENYSNYTGLYVEWLVYNANGHIAKELDIPVRQRFTEIVDYSVIYKTRGKSIVQTSKVKAMSAHFPILNTRSNNMVDSNHIKVNLRHGHNCPLDKIVIDHYYTKSYEEWCEKINKGSCCPFTERKMDEFFILNPELKGAI